ncbi:sigma-70 family RNA polymerase sigma factor [Candidatus Dependentiae bacterium]|nr:MAG: sigma-70 family RNA polymerase sigma factor [Candidatus Dependentiae bacterium]
MRTEDLTTSRTKPFAKNPAGRVDPLRNLDRAPLEDPSQATKNVALASIEAELQNAQQLQWLRAWRSGNTRAFDKLYESMQALLYSFVRPFIQKGITKDDLMSEANMGLLQGLLRFDDARKVKIATYVMWWVRNYVWTYVDIERRQGTCRRANANIKRAEKLMKLLPNATRDELIAAGTTAASISNAVNRKQMKIIYISSLNFHHDGESQDETQEEAAGRVFSMIDATPSAEDQLIEHERQQRLRKAVGHATTEYLTQKQRDTVLTLYASDDLTMADIARERNHKRQAVDNICRAAYSNIRPALLRNDFIKEEIVGLKKDPSHQKVRAQKKAMAQGMVQV